MSSLPATPSSSGGGGGGGGGPSPHFQQQFTTTKQLIVTVRQQLTLLESGHDTSVALQGRLSTQINSLSHLTAALTAGVASLPAPLRDLWLIKVEQVAQEYAGLRQSMERYFQRAHQRHQHEERRRRLLHRRAAYDGEASALMQTSESIANSQRAAEEILEMGTHVRASLAEQNDTLKRVRRRVYDVLNQFELSRSLLRVIERRRWVDSMIVLGGVIATTCVLVGIWYYLS